MLKHAVDEAVNADTAAVVVMLGENAALFTKEIDNEKARVIENKKWKEGMASSIRLGLNTLLSIHPSVESVILMVCDQPFISTAVLNGLLAIHRQTGKPVVACNYGETIGTPALFYKSLFHELMQLKGDKGAKSIIRQYKEEMAMLQFPMGRIDIDSQTDYEKLINS